MSRKYNPATMPTMSSALYKGLNDISSLLESLQKLSRSETEVWTEEQRANDPETFDDLMATIENLKELELKEIPKENLNNLLKGFLFAQEMFDNTSMDFFYQQHKDKYEVLFNRGSNQDKIIFQGSSAEGLSILRIDEIVNSKSEASYGQLKWRRLFDFDILCVKNMEVIDGVVNGMADVFTPCKHSGEPLLMMRWGTGQRRKRHLYWSMLS